MAKYKLELPTELMQVFKNLNFCLKSPNFTHKTKIVSEAIMSAGQ